jgi:ribulose-phosphate 3-epimerase
MLISLSILDYEPDLAAHLGDIAKSESMAKIRSLVQTGKIHRVHIDVMRPPMIPDRTTFPIEVIAAIYGHLKDKIALAAHLMVHKPFPIINRLNTFIPDYQREEFAVIIQRESFETETQTVDALKLLKKYGYTAGICLNLPTPRTLLTKGVINKADAVLLMTVPMGHGGQEYSDEGTKRIAYFSHLFPEKTLEIDGGISPETIIAAEEAGAKVAVVGSFITRSKDPVKAVFQLERSLKHARS